MDDETRENLKKPQSAPKVPKELLSARPAMTKVKPKMPDAAAEASQATQAPPEPTMEELEERQQRMEYLRSLRGPDKKKRGGKKWWVIALFILGLLLVGVAVYIFLKKPAQTKPTSNSDTQQTVTQPTNTTPQADDQTADMKTYDSTNFALSFKYPQGWTINDTASGLTAISPKTTLTDATGSKKPAAVVLHIRPQQASIPEFKAGSATAVLDSKNITYTAPASGQRGSTYESFLQYATTTTHGALDSIYITGNAGYQKAQTVPMTDISKVNPLINVSFVDCTSTCTPTSQAISVSASDWQSNALSQTVELMLKSLTLN
jgi:cytoskeletal protein RodZ